MKKVLSLLLIVAMVLSMSISAFAIMDYSLYLTSNDQGIIRKDDPVGDSVTTTYENNFYYEAVDGKWYMENFNFNTAAWRGIIISEDTTIVISGTNTITVSGNDYGTVNAIDSIFSGSAYYNLAFEGTGTLTINMNGSNDQKHSLGIKAQSLTINGPTVNITKDNVTTSSNGASIRGVYVHDTNAVTITSGTLNITTGYINADGGYVQNMGIYGNAVVNGGELKLNINDAVGGTAESVSYGVEKALTVNSGVAEIQTGEVSGSGNVKSKSVNGAVNYTSASVVLLGDDSGTAIKVSHASGFYPTVKYLKICPPYLQLGSVTSNCLTSSTEDDWNWNGILNTLEILNDVTFNGPILYNGSDSWEIDLNGHTLTVNSGSYYPSGIKSDYNNVKLYIKDSVGGGSLTVQGTKSGIALTENYLGEAILTIEDSVTLAVTGVEYGIVAASVAIVDGASYNITGGIKAIKSDATYTSIPTDAIYTPVGATILTATNIQSPVAPDAPEVEEDKGESDVDIELNGMSMKIEYGNNTFVFKNVSDIKRADTGMVNYQFILDRTGYKVDSIILNKEVYDYINRDIEITLPYGGMVIENPTTIDNSFRMTLGEGVATYLQKNTVGQPENELYISYNGTDTAKIYAPGEGTKVYYVIDEFTLGELPCEQFNHYCIFDYYKEGTYVITK